MSKTRVITPEAIASYPTLVEAEAMNEGEEPKFSVALVFPLGTDLTELKEAVKAAAVEKFGAKAGAVLKSNNPFRTDGETKGYPAGSVFFNARTKMRPGVVSQVPNKDGRPTVIDAASIYPGAIVKASITTYGYDVKGNKGIGFGLNNIQFIRDGERLDSNIAAQDEFAADENAVADLSDLDEEIGATSDDGFEDDPLADLGF